MREVEKWGLFEVSSNGKSDGNPFRDYAMTVTFKSDKEEKSVSGFYDGNGVYKARFMPSHEGVYTYVIQGNFSDRIENAEGSFEAVAPSRNNHGPVEVVDKVHLRYADRTPYYSVGTTCYAWANQPMKRQEQTLETLKNSPFNKIRFCFFPKFYEFNRTEPLTYPFERGNGEGLDPELVAKEPVFRMRIPGEPETEQDYGFDYTRPNVEHFKRFDKRIAQLMEMGIEADMILMHPYDKWGLNEMDKEACDRYLKYVVARYSAYRNIWWSLANEFDFIKVKTAEDWERYGQIVSANDPFHKLLSVHNGGANYDFSKSWVTHCSLQRTDFYRTTEDTDRFVEKYGKPVVWDEICYEGNIGIGWGNITAEELVRRFWEAFMRGGYCGHGETYMDPEDILWWSHGGILKGESPARLRFLLDVLKDVPGGYLSKGEGLFDEVVGYAGGHTGEGMHTCYDYAIHYLGICRPAFRRIFLPEDADYEVEVIDTWNMTIQNLGILRGHNRIELPGRQYMALRIRKAGCCAPA
ncbi:MAG: DUF5605 domain-containing protein [Lachnospiraceae bacterium]|nr:DUF5605 domain-containing protein [uncultured Acetatifactor sp.]MCI8543353.1 DUF5605 domain-containing protein [Lachnospiraceae bacterium]